MFESFHIKIVEFFYFFIIFRVHYYATEYEKYIQTIHLQLQSIDYYDYTVIRLFAFGYDYFV